MTSLRTRIEASRKGAATRKRMAQLRGIVLTPRRAELLTFIVKYRSEYGYAPSTKEMTAALNYASHGTLIRHLDALTAGGFITRVPSAPRTIVPTEMGWLSILNGTELSHSREKAA